VRVVRKTRILAVPFLLALAATGSGGSRAWAQESGAPAAADSAGAPVSVDSADAIRASLKRPPTAPSPSAWEFVDLPLKIAMYPLDMFTRGAAVVIGQFSRPAAPAPYIEAINAADNWGLSPIIGSVGQRSGLAGQLKFHRFDPFFIRLGFSARSSQRHYAGFEFGDKRVTGARLAYKYQRDAQAHFWGIGARSRKRHRSDFQREQNEAMLSGWARLSHVVSLKGEAAYENDLIKRGLDDDKPDVQDIFAPGTLFGLSQRLEYFRVGASAALNFTHREGFQTHGVRFGIGTRFFRGTGGTDSDFHVISGEFAGYLPVNPRNTFAFRGLVDVTRPDGGAGIPFYYLAANGSTNGNRGYSSWRFRDRDRLALQVDWRYEIWRDLHDRSRMEVFTFVDESATGRNLNSFSSRDYRFGYGFGMRAVTINGLLGLFYLGLSEEGTRFRVKTKWPF